MEHIWKIAYLLILLALMAFPVLAARISGEIIALDGSQVQVRTADSEEFAALPGDSVTFQADVGGLEISAGSGAVVSHNASVIVVEVSDGKPGLGMKAIIDASGGRKKPEDQAPATAKEIEPAKPEQPPAAAVPPRPIEQMTLQEQWQEAEKLLKTKPSQLSESLKTRRLSLLRNLANNDHPEGQNWLGSGYEYGLLELTKDIPKAIHWHLKAAEQGNEHSISSVGRLLLYDDPESGLKGSWKKAYPWLIKAAELGDGTAMYNLAAAYGRTWEKTDPGFDYDKAVYWYQRSIEAGNEYAAEDLAELRRKVEGR